MSNTITLSSTHVAVPLSRFEPIAESAAAVGKLLKPECHEHAKEGYRTLITNLDKLRGEKIVLENAQKSLAEAKAALKVAQSIAKLAVPTAINLGKMMDLGSIANFVPRDESWLEAIETLASRFEAHGESSVAATLLKQVGNLHHAEDTVMRETAQLDRASQAFSATYRHLSSDITYGRAVLNKLDIAVPSVSKTAGKKQPRKAVEVPAPKADVVPALVPAA